MAKVACKEDATRETAAQLGHEIADALANKTVRSLRVPLSKMLAWAIKRHSGFAVFNALRRVNRSYMFETSDPGEVRAFWHALAKVYYDTPWTTTTRAVVEAAEKKRKELLPAITAAWPEAMAE